ncbi:MAG TPA: pentapeptide repeat-containing protein, partial [Micromonosporaceae bacterium]|nr:pentapeptide repeat-containing protein [Micromonosporaceae bacterium]
MTGPEGVKHDPWQRVVAIGSLVSVLFVGIGLYITNEANREQQRITEQGQITERFTTAVEQLGQPGPDKIEVRLGAIYALERIMRDSAADHPAVVQVLAAFVRVHAPAPTPSPTPPEGMAEPTAPPPPPVDIQAALTVLSRRDTNRDQVVDELNLAHTNLRGADLHQADLHWADLSGADLSGADLGGADLGGADLSGAILIGANLGGTNLDHAFLDHADLRYADLANAELNAYLFDAKMADADLRGADLGEARGVTTESVR